MKRIFCILLLLCLYFNCFAQRALPGNKALAIGDTMPDVVMHQLYNYPLKTLRFSAFQKELTIIDFWASWCGACIAAFPKMQALQHSFGDQLQVLLVNASPHDDANKIAAFLKRRKVRTGNELTLPYLVEDSLFSRLFPYKVIPHYVWLDQNRKVLAITDGDAVTEANIAALLAGKQPGLAFKNDALLFDEARDQLILADTAAAGSVLYRSVLTTARPGLGQKLMWKVAANEGVTQLRVLNFDLVSLYQSAFSAAFDRSDGRLEVEAGLEPLVARELVNGQRPAYCYELQVPAMDRSAALRFLATDLERAFSITALEVVRPTPVLVLTAGKKSRALLTKNGKPETNMDPESIAPFMMNVSLTELTDALQMVLKTTVLNETAMRHNIDLRFPANFFHFTTSEVIVFLAEQGLLLQQQQRMLPVTRLQVANPLQLPKTTE